MRAREVASALQSVCFPRAAFLTRTMVFFFPQSAIKGKLQELGAYVGKSSVVSLIDFRICSEFNFRNAFFLSCL